MQNSFKRCAFGGLLSKKVSFRALKNASLKAERTMQKNTWGWDMAIFGSVRPRVSKTTRLTPSSKEDAKPVD